MNPTHSFNFKVRVVTAIAKVTFREVIRDKVLYNLFLFSFLFLGVGWLASRLTVIRPERVILDFGLSSIGVSCGVIAVLSGATLIGRELEKRTIQVALSRPISRFQFLLGKFVGLGGVITLNWLLLSATYLSLLTYISDDSKSMISATLGIALLFVWVQSIVLVSMAVLFSTVSTASLSVMFAFGFYLVGTNISQLQMAASKIHSTVGRTSLYAAVSFLPNFEYFNLGTQVVYGLPMSLKFVFLSLAYGLVLITTALMLAGVLIHVREV